MTKQLTAALLYMTKDHPFLARILLSSLISMPPKPEGRKGLFSLLPDGFKIARPSARRKSTKYLVPEHIKEMERQISHHYAIRQLLHGNFSAPVEDALERGIKVADIGCGFGTWMIEMARDFPASTFIGTDVDGSTLPTHDDIPGNCSFLKSNTLTGLPFPDNTFDYVFQRCLVLAFTPTEWDRVLAELVRVTKPGGWLELFDSNGLMERAPESYQKYNDAWLNSLHARSVDAKIVENFGDFFRRSGLINIVSEQVSCPVGWYDRAGELTGQSMELHRLSCKEQLAPIMGMTEPDYERWAIAVTKDIEENRSWINAYYAFGMKAIEEAA